MAQLLDIVKQAGEQNLGRTLIRLAELAAAAHARELAAPGVDAHAPHHRSPTGAAEVSSFRMEVER